MLAIMILVSDGILVLIATAWLPAEMARVHEAWEGAERAHMCAHAHTHKFSSSSKENHTTSLPESAHHPF